MAEQDEALRAAREIGAALGQAGRLFVRALMDPDWPEGEQPSRPDPEDPAWPDGPQVGDLLRTQDDLDAVPQGAIIASHGADRLPHIIAVAQTTIEPDDQDRRRWERTGDGNLRSAHALLGQARTWRVVELPPGPEGVIPVTAAVGVGVVALVAVAAALAAWWSARRSAGLVATAQRAATQAARRLDDATAGRVPLVTVLVDLGLPRRRAEQMAREIGDRVAAELDKGRAARVQGGSASRLEGHPVGASAAFRPAGRERAGAGPVEEAPVESPRRRRR